MTSQAGTEYLRTGSWAKVAESLEYYYPKTRHETFLYLREVTKVVVGFFPGLGSCIDAVFEVLELIHEKHGSEFENIMSEIFTGLKQVSKDDAPMDRAMKGLNILYSTLKRLTSLFGSTMSDLASIPFRAIGKIYQEIALIYSMACSFRTKSREKLKEAYQKIIEILDSGLTADSAQKLKIVMMPTAETIWLVVCDVWKESQTQSTGGDSMNDAKSDKSIEKLEEEFIQVTKQLFKTCLKILHGAINEDHKNPDFEEDPWLSLGTEPFLLLYIRLFDLDRITQGKGGQAEKIARKALVDVAHILQETISEIQQLEADSNKN
ncbi:hypothetical protein K3495_g1792 [Podosphaera aphanis]|nr:hypothetical protein K3495_g1792 [Podosphaera aphanis]